MSKKKKKQKQEPQSPDVDAQLMESFMSDEPLVDEEPLEDETPEEEFEETPEEEPEEEEQEEEVEEEEPEEEPAEEPEEPAKLYKVRGKEYTLDQLAEAGMLDDMVTQSEQVAHYQQLYHEAKAEADKIIEQQERMRAQAAAQQQAAARPSPEQIQAFVQPYLNQAVHEGWMDQDFVELYPQAAATQAYIYQDYVQLKQLVGALYQHIQRGTMVDARTNLQNTIDHACDNLVNAHDVYKPLGNPQERQKFLEYLVQVNPPAAAINEEFLASQYLAYQRTAILEAVKQSSQGQRKAGKRKRKLAAGEGSPAPRQGKAKQLSVDEAMIDQFMQMQY